VLKHWRRKGDVGSIGAAMPVTPADSNAASEMETDDKTTTTIPDSYWAKYNVKVERPQYTDEQYETHLKSEDWSREETDYLVGLAYEFDLRWIIIADRYEYQQKEAPQESEDSMAVTIQAKPRTQEDMKARYYDVAAKAMVLHNPLSTMSSSEFDTHEKMTKYDPLRETQRKKYAEQLMQRTEEEKYEEEMLLKELSRIVSNQEKLFNERKALHDRLDTATSTSRENFSTTMYQSSQGLTQLMQTLLTQNKNKELEKKEKRRSAIEAGDVAGGLERGHRHSISGADKRSSTAGDSARRQLNAREEAKWGVSHPNERLTGGIQFRHERVTKAGQAKSGVQTSRIGAALTELKVAPRLFMPTAKVVTEYEALIEKIKILLEVRKVSEKTEAEIKVWRQQREQLEAKERGEEVKEEEGSQRERVNEEDDEEETSKVDVLQNDESKIEDDNEDAASENDDDEDDETKEENQNDSDAEAENQNEESNNESEEEDADVDANADENDVENEVKELQDEEEEEDEAQEEAREEAAEADLDGNEEDEDEAMADAASSAAPSPAPTTKSEGIRKRSASIASHISNRSSKRQRK